jgi:hypothetical protein
MLRCMRTTLTLDDDVAARLDQLREERRLPLKQLVNDALRRGLAELESPRTPRRKSFTSPESLGGLLLPSLDDVHGALDLVEGDARRT